MRKSGTNRFTRSKPAFPRFWKFAWFFLHKNLINSKVMRNRFSAAGPVCAQHYEDQKKKNSLFKGDVSHLAIGSLCPGATGLPLLKFIFYKRTTYYCLNWKIFTLIFAIRIKASHLSMDQGYSFEITWEIIRCKQSSYCFIGKHITFFLIMILFWFL